MTCVYDIDVDTIYYSFCMCRCATSRARGGVAESASSLGAKETAAGREMSA
jgi:hypothetical protein